MTEKNPAAQALRAIPSEKRSQTSRENGKKGGRPQSNPCDCGICKTCISREYQRQRRAKLNQKGELKMITVTYTEAKTVKGEFKNLYKSRKFRDLSDATDFYNKLINNPNITDVRIIR